MRHLSSVFAFCRFQLGNQTNFYQCLDAPKVLDGLESTFSPAIGSSLLLPCEWTVAPTELVWTFLDNISKESVEITAELAEEKGLIIHKEQGLLIKNVSESSVGTYTCVGSNKFGSDISVILIAEVGSKLIFHPTYSPGIFDYFRNRIKSNVSLIHQLNFFHIRSFINKKH